MTLDDLPWAHFGSVGRACVSLNKEWTIFRNGDGTYDLNCARREDKDVEGADVLTAQCLVNHLSKLPGG